MNDHAKETAPTQGRRRLRLGTRSMAIGGLVMAAVFAATIPLPSRAKAASTSIPEAGIVCTTSTSSAGHDSFVLTARDGYILTPDGNSIYNWGYSPGNAAFQYPGPMLCVREGDLVTITLKNTLPIATSLLFPAIEGVTKDGALALPSATDMIGGNLTPSIPPTQSATYQFTADHAGTYLYESGTNPEVQDQMGLIGALIVRPSTVGSDKCADGVTICGSVYDPNTGPDTVNTQFEADREFVHLLSEIDPDVHQCMEASLRVVDHLAVDGEVYNGACPVDSTGKIIPFTYNMTKYKPRYFMINGRSFPDDIKPNYSESLPSQPYSALVHVRPRGAEADGKDVGPAVVRYLNAGPIGYPFHPHVENERVVGQDGRKIVSSSGGDITQDQFDIVVPPGGTVDAFFSWTDAEGWAPTGVNGSGQNNDIGVPVPHEADRKNGAYWSGSPYLGYQTPPKATETNFNECGEYYNVAHSHALFQATNYGASMGGMLTMIRIDPPGGCS